MRRARLLVPVALIATATAAAPDTSWYLVSDDDGGVLGHVERQVVTLPDGREIVETRRLRLTEADQRAATIVERSMTRLDAASRPTRITSVMQQGATTTRTDARIDGALITVTRESHSGRQADRITLPPGTRLDSGEALLADPATVFPLDFANFSLATLAVERVTIERAPVQRSGTLSLLRKRFDGDQLRGVMRLDLDERRHIVAASQPMFGIAVTTRPTDKATATAGRPPYRLLRNVMTKSPFRIGPVAAAGQIRYRFAFRDGIAFAPPATPEQRATPDSDGVTLDICASCGPGLPSEPHALADARRATAWLQRDHPRIQSLAAPIARQAIPDSRKMTLLAQRARQVMTRVDFTGHVSAADALARGAGDCTEDAVILAALGRAAGIPTRVASGLVYSRERYHGVSNVFMPHSWTLAYVDGAWRSFDMSLDGFDATHIALTVGDGDARSIAAAGQLASLLVWQQMNEVRKRASP